MNQKPRKNTKFNRYVGRNKKEIRKILMTFLLLFIVNFILFTVDIYTDGTAFFFQWPLIISGIFFIIYVIRIASWKKRHTAPKAKKEDGKGNDEKNTTSFFE